jgi:hypothetical protein
LKAKIPVRIKLVQELESRIKFSAHPLDLDIFLGYDVQLEGQSRELEDC